MWRIFRLGIKSNSCSGNQAHFRIIGTTCANSDENKDVEDSNTFGTIGNKENYEAFCHHRTLAEKATKDHLKDFDINTDLNVGHSHLPSSTNYKKGGKIDVNKESFTGSDIVTENCSIEILSKETFKITSYRSVSDVGFSSTKSEKLVNPVHQKIKSNDSSDLTNATVFGTLSKVTKFDASPDDCEDIPHPLKGTFGKRLTDHQYGRKMLALCRERKLKEAIDVLEIEMVDQNVRPDTYCFNVLINACGKAGYMKKAVGLFHKMKQIGLHPEKFAYTGVFNACGNVSDELKECGLREASTLRRQIKEKGIIVSPITYHAMIKAFGRCGDLKTAFEIVDDMLLAKQRITTDTMNFLLQGCISDKEAGFRHALMVWRKLKMLKLSRNIYSYNLLLRCLKECQAGDQALFSQLLDPPAKNVGMTMKGLFSNNKQSQKKELKQVYSDKTNNSENSYSISTEGFLRINAINEKGELYQILTDKDLVKVRLEDNMEMELVNYDVPIAVEKPDFPDLLDMRFFSLGKVIALASLSQPNDRLALLGGPAGVLKNMIKDKVQPTIATFTFLLESLPPKLEAENSLLTSMTSCKVKPDITFFNMLIKKRALRNCYEHAKDVLDLMRIENIHPDIITYGCMALASVKPEEGLNLLDDMRKFSIRPNIEILGALIYSSVRSKEYMYTIQLLRKMSKYNIEANEKILNYLEEARKSARKTLLEKERNEKTTKCNKYTMRKNEEMKLYLLEYKHWLKKSYVQMPDHPWAQYGHQRKAIVKAP